MWPSTPATLQYSLTMAPSSRSLKRDTNARIRASSRAFAATKERSKTTRLPTSRRPLLRQFRKPLRNGVHARNAVLSSLMHQRLHGCRESRSETLGLQRVNVGSCEVGERVGGEV